ncbi:MAG: NAD(P)H-dependent oxidoreductase subunit E [Clostridia bacterium]|nr:NAD(P)H-dependent oxidoreductase subunit E [Clostridia bacterium]MBQ4543811.1 NAD(P)H-dependent oxidoreductase subunit E [Clostridia bacterium]MBQ7075807.1 NAD(P)H-dependent oxidoreductase subunit E [Clostridia bacterium]MBQ9997955.1 NAD(P)H-dependent oxidoreductase subunit E [Clostridia bacterium]
MAKSSTIPFAGTKEQKEKLDAVIAKHKDMEGGLIPVLHQAQEIYGYLPIEVQQMIAEGLNIPMAEVYGVVTFYTQFTTNPKGKYKIAVCLGTACYVKGSQELVDRISQRLNIGVGECTPDGKFSLDATRCIGACGLAPVLTVNDDVYGRLTAKDIDGILDKYINE